MIPRPVRFSLLIVLGAAAAAPALLACGDKFLLPALGTHFERSRASRQAAAVLVYAAPASDLARSLATLAVDPALHKEGYAPTYISSAPAFEAALRASRWDVVVVDARDMPPMPSVGAPGPRVVPVMHAATKDELKAARARFGTALCSPTKARAFVDVLDDALDRHDADVKAAAKQGAR